MDRLEPEILVDIVQRIDRLEWNHLRQVRLPLRPLMVFLNASALDAALGSPSMSSKEVPPTWRTDRRIGQPYSRQCSAATQVCRAWKELIGKSTTRLMPSTLDVDLSLNFPNLRCLDLSLYMPVPHQLIAIHATIPQLRELLNWTPCCLYELQSSHGYQCHICPCWEEVCTEGRSAGATPQRGDWDSYPILFAAVAAV